MEYRYLVSGEGVEPPTCLLLSRKLLWPSELSGHCACCLIYVLASGEGVEPTASPLGGKRSILLSYPDILCAASMSSIIGGYGEVVNI